MKVSIRRRLAAGKRRIEQRLDKANCQGCDRPMLRPLGIQYELADRTRGMTYGGIGSMLLLVRKLGLADAIDRRLHLLKIHLPYHESDHVLNFAFNALCDGTCLEDLELRRNDEVYLDAVHARRIPDPTTAGDFCRRFQPHDVRTLLDVFNETRLKVWARQPDAFFDEARIDMDGTLVSTTGECKQGMDISYKGDWGYHPLVVTLANTGEVLSVVNRPGNRPSHEGCPAEVDRVLDVCRRGGFRRVLLRGDTDFTQTKHLDRWRRGRTVAVYLRRRLHAGLTHRGRRFTTNCLENTGPPGPLPGETPAACSARKNQRADRGRARIQEHPPDRRSSGRV